MSNHTADDDAPIYEMKRAVMALALKVPAPVFNDVRHRWNAVAHRYKGVRAELVDLRNLIATHGDRNVISALAAYDEQRPSGSTEVRS